MREKYAGGRETPAAGSKQAAAAEGAAGSQAGAPEGAGGERLSARQRRELRVYLLACIAALEFLLASGAVFYAFVNGYTGPDGRFVFSFPLLAFAASGLGIPALLLLFVHFADVGLFRPAGSVGTADGKAWHELLPERPAKLYRILRGLPTVALLAGTVILGAALLTLDSVLSALGRLASALTPHIGTLLICLSVLTGLIAAGVLLLRYRTRKMLAEYEYRRDVLEKTGIIIVEKDSRALPWAGMDVEARVLTAAEGGLPALPAAENKEAGE
jgi:hypothetical protein